MASSSTLPHIVIVGGGAGGIELAVRLGRTVGGKAPGRPRARITVVDRTPAHLWKPRLHEIATGLLAAEEEEAGFAAQAELHGFDFALGEMTGLDIAGRSLQLGPVPWPDNEGPHPADPLMPARTIAFDHLVLAFGSRVNDFGTPGVADYCYMLDSPQQAQELHRAFLARAFQMQMKQCDALRIGIVGAGATGVELAAELHHAVFHLGKYGRLLQHGQLQVTVLDMADRVLPAVDRDTSDYARHELDRRGIQVRLGTKVVKVTEDALELESGETLRAEIKVWASGVRGLALAQQIGGLDLNRNGQIRVDPALRALAPGGGVHAGIYCIGDCAAFTDAASGKPVAPTAQAAHQQAVLLARSLRGVLRGAAPLPFRFRYKGTVVSLGAEQAAGDLPRATGPNGAGTLAVRGRGAKLLYIGLYRMHMAALYGWPRTAALSLSNLLRRTVQPPVKLH